MKLKQVAKKFTLMTKKRNTYHKTIKDTLKESLIYSDASDIYKRIY